LFWWKNAMAAKRLLDRMEPFPDFIAQRAIGGVRFREGVKSLIEVSDMYRKRRR
jgi:hypothetical protein